MSSVFQAMRTDEAEAAHGRAIFLAAEVIAGQQWYAIRTAYPPAPTPERSADDHVDVVFSQDPSLARAVEPDRFAADAASRAINNILHGENWTWFDEVGQRKLAVLTGQDVSEAEKEAVLGPPGEPPCRGEKLPVRGTRLPEDGPIDEMFLDGTEPVDFLHRDAVDEDGRTDLKYFQETRGEGSYAAKIMKELEMKARIRLRAIGGEADGETSAELRPSARRKTSAAPAPDWRVTLAGVDLAPWATRWHAGESLKQLADELTSAGTPVNQSGLLTAFFAGGHLKPATA